MPVSIFNDVIGPVMRGPSSSHCAAALRIGRLARDLMGGTFSSVHWELDRAGSLPTTHESQGSDMGLFGGLMGWDAADERLPDSPRILADTGVKLRIETADLGDPHPNTYRLTLENGTTRHSLRALSTGGGAIEVTDIDGFPVSMNGGGFETLIFLDRSANGAEVQESLAALLPDGEIQTLESSAGRAIWAEGETQPDEAGLAALSGTAGIREIRVLRPVLPVLSPRAARVPFSTAAELMAHDGDRRTPLWRLAMDYEGACARMPDEPILAEMVKIVRILRKSIAQGIAGTAYDDRVLGPQAPMFDQALKGGRLLHGGGLNRTILYVTALMDVKSSMGVIVAAPTAGACAALPGVVIAMAEEMGLGEDEMARALLAAGLIGAFIATRWTFAAEVGGCQAEGGSAASMAAAALVTLAGGTRDQALAAASMAFQSMIGLVCDPVANRVEVPCLGKNVMAAANALSCANMALAGFDQVIPLDEVIETARRVATQMPRELRCTALGGLSITPTSLALEARLAGKKAGCGKSGCGCG